MIALSFNNGAGDIIRRGLGAIETRDDLETAVIISLFLDAREDTRAPDARGWWAGAIGSKLWALHPGKATEATRSDAERYAQDALAWMTAEGVAQQVTCAAAYGAEHVLNLAIEIVKPDGASVAYTYALNWAAQAAGGALNGLE
jgi:phage gp46-like protein